MSQLQGQVLTDNLNIEKERPSDATKAGYWPGHVVAECLMDDTLDNSINSLNESSDKLVSYSDKKRLSNNNETDQNFSKYPMSANSPNLVRLNSSNNEINKSFYDNKKRCIS